MEANGTVIFLLLVFGAVFLLVNSIAVPTFGAQKLESKRLRQRINGMSDGNQFDRTNSLVRERYLRNLSPTEQAIERLPGMQGLEELLEQAGEFFPAYRLVLVCIAVGLIAGIGCWLLSKESLYGLVAGVVATFVPILWFKRKAAARLEKFEEQLPDALDMMTRALRAGHPFTETLRMVATELGDPIGKEFGMTFDEINYGVDVRIAFQNMLIRVPTLSLVALVTSVIVQRESGGNLAEVLQKISAVIRGRFRFHRKVRSLTAEGRMSAWVLVTIPLFLFGFLSVTNPTYLPVLFTDPVGRKMVGVAIGLALLGALWVRKLLRIEV
jgi:tight adherence protein B